MSKLTQEEKELKKFQAEVAKQRNQPPVESVTLTIEWSRAGHPNCTGLVRYASGHDSVVEARVGVGGYDKESALLADVINEVLRYKMWEYFDTNPDPESVPYGLSRPGPTWTPLIFRGVGVSSVEKAVKALGFELKRVAWSKTSDHYELTKMQ